MTSHILHFSFSFKPWNSPECKWIDTLSMFSYNVQCMSISTLYKLWVPGKWAFLGQDKCIHSEKSKSPQKRRFLFKYLSPLKQFIQTIVSPSLPPSLSPLISCYISVFSQAKTHSLFISLLDVFSVNNEPWTQKIWPDSSLKLTLLVPTYIFLDLLYSSNTPNTLFLQELLLIFFIHYQTKEKYPFWGWRERRKANHPP